MVNVLPPALESVRLAVVMPLSPSARPVGDDSAELFKLKPPGSLIVAVAFVVPVNEPPPVQPVTVNDLPEAVANRLAVVNPLRPRLIPSVEDRVVFESVKLEPLLAATVSPAAPVATNNAPAPVQPPTVKVWPPVGSVRLAVLNPLRVKLGPPGTASEVFVNVAPAATPSTSVSEAPLSEPPPVQPVTVNVSPPPLLLSVRLAVTIPLSARFVLGALSSALVRAKGPLAESVTVPTPAPTTAVSDPVPVQPVTLKLLAVVPEPVRAATAIPLRLSMKLGDAPVNLVLVRV